MTPQSIRHLFSKVSDDPYYEDEFIDWYVWEAGAKEKDKRRLFTLTYCTASRSFSAVLKRSDTDDGAFEFEITLPRKMTELFQSMLTPQQIAHCTRASLAI